MSLISQIFSIGTQSVILCMFMQIRLVFVAELQRTQKLTALSL